MAWDTSSSNSQLAVSRSQQGSTIVACHCNHDCNHTSVTFICSYRRSVPDNRLSVFQTDAFRGGVRHRRSKRLISLKLSFERYDELFMHDDSMRGSKFGTFAISLFPNGKLSRQNAVRTFPLWGYAFDSAASRRLIALSN